MSITIELPIEVENRVLSIAAAEGLSPAAILTRLAISVFGTEAEEIDPEDLAALREGIADADAGRTIDLEEYIAGVEARDAVVTGQRKVA